MRYHKFIITHKHLANFREQEKNITNNSVYYCTTAGREVNYIEFQTNTCFVEGV